MKPKLFFIGLILSIFLTPNARAEGQIPQVILDQKITAWDSSQPQNDTRIMINPANGRLKGPPASAKLADWRLGTKEEAQLIADSLIKNSEDELGVSFNDLKIRSVTFSADPNYDYYNPSAAIWYDHYFNGIPVFDSALSLNINAYGTIWSGKNRLITDITAPTAPIITADDSIQIAKKRYNQIKLNLEKAPELYIFSYPSALYYESKANKLAWHLNLLQPVGKEIMIDSQNGEIILENQNFVTGNSNIPLTQKQTANIYYFLIPIIVILPILAYFILKKRK